MPYEPVIVAIISPDRGVHESIMSSLEGNSNIETLWTVAQYPDRTGLQNLKQAAKGCVVFLDFRDAARAQGVSAEIDRAYPLVNVVAVLPALRPLALTELMELGIRETIQMPLVATEVRMAFAKAAARIQPAAQPVEEASGSVYAFLPSKPGVGATTLAAHGAAAAARLSNQRTLLIDFDFRLGMTSFLFKLSGNYSVLDAIARASSDPELWDRMVCRRGMLDILASAPVEFGAVDPEHGAVALLDLARSCYGAVCVDLPGEMRQYEIETLERATECFLVTTPEIGSLHMASRKAEKLRALGLRNKTSVIMNRAGGRGGMATREVETILQLPVRFSVSSAEREIAEATVAGLALEGRSSLVKEIENIAQRINPGAVTPREAKSRKFIEMFSVSPVRDRSHWGW